MSCKKWISNSEVHLMQILDVKVHFFNMSSNYSRSLVPDMLLLFSPLLLSMSAADSCISYVLLHS